MPGYLKIGGAYMKIGGAYLKIGESAGATFGIIGNGDYHLEQCVDPPSTTISVTNPLAQDQLLIVCIFANIFSDCCEDPPSISSDFTIIGSSYVVESNFSTELVRVYFLNMGASASGDIIVSDWDDNNDAIVALYATPDVDLTTPVVQVSSSCSDNTNGSNPVDFNEDLVTTLAAYSSVNNIGFTVGWASYNDDVGAVAGWTLPTGADDASNLAGLFNFPTPMDVFPFAYFKTNGGNPTWTRTDDTSDRACIAFELKAA